jgi:hypothetical protein
MTSFKDEIAKLRKERNSKEAARILSELPEAEDTEVTAVFIRRLPEKKKEAEDQLPPPEGGRRATAS